MSNLHIYVLVGVICLLLYIVIKLSKKIEATEEENKMLIESINAKVTTQALSVYREFDTLKKISKKTTAGQNKLIKSLKELLR